MKSEEVQINVCRSKASTKRLKWRDGCSFESFKHRMNVLSLGFCKASWEICLWELPERRQTPTIVMNMDETSGLIQAPRKRRLWGRRAASSSQRPCRLIKDLHLIMKVRGTMVLHIYTLATISLTKILKVSIDKNLYQTGSFLLYDNIKEDIFFSSIKWLVVA